MAKAKIHKGDQVMVISGKEAGKTGKVMRIDPDKGRLVVERLNMMRRHTRPNPKKNPQGGVIEREGSMDTSNVMLVCPACNQPTRVGFRVADGGHKVRVCRRSNCGADIDKA
ncbi:MAG TPA: 50S ribosomal protein L24 [Thermoleophilia bacterium]|nr:50S ribosomal protein L24 [Thermoleophilia bacterium]